MKSKWARLRQFRQELSPDTSRPLKDLAREEAILQAKKQALDYANTYHVALSELLETSDRDLAFLDESRRWHRFESEGYISLTTQNVGCARLRSSGTRSTISIVIG